MKTVSLTPKRDVAVGRLAKALAKKAQQITTSASVNAALAATAFGTLIAHEATGGQAAIAASALTAWALHLATLITADIRQKGGER